MYIASLLKSEEKVFMKDTTLFQYCQKLVLFRNDGREVLLAKRTGEADYDGTYTFVGGKMETTDADIVAGLKREKDEEIGSEAQISVYPKVSYNVYSRARKPRPLGRGMNGSLERTQCLVSV
jgi:ADP-ribose pyrophosphatase YjhB (NUDIX family)